MPARLLVRPHSLARSTLQDIEAEIEAGLLFVRDDGRRRSNRRFYNHVMNTSSESPVKFEGLFFENFGKWV